MIRDFDVSSMRVLDRMDPHCELIDKRKIFDLIEIARKRRIMLDISVSESYPEFYTVCIFKQVYL